MKLNRILAVLFVMFTAVSAEAVMVRGLVKEVRDGQSIVVAVNGRNLNVQLRGVAAPVLTQDFGDVSRQHLASLILEKPVEIQFSELQSEKVIAKVICNDLDIGLQVIRDGAAWFDKINNQRLTEDERALYSEAERLARSEMRGLWIDGSPMPPWEWKRGQQAKVEAPVLTTYKRRSASSLESADIMSSQRADAVSTPATGSSSARSTPKPTARPLNVPGQDFNFQSYFTRERVSIVYFYADWCPACRSFNPLMDAINAQISDMQVLFMNIGDWNTPVTQRYNVRSVPYLLIYDKSGGLIAEGRDARTWLQQTMAQRAGK